jgi:hypothetical protein
MASLDGFSTDKLSFLDINREKLLALLEFETTTLVFFAYFEHLLLLLDLQGSQIQLIATVQFANNFFGH